MWNKFAVHSQIVMARTFNDGLSVSERIIGIEEVIRAERDHT